MTTTAVQAIAGRNSMGSSDKQLEELWALLDHYRLELIEQARAIVRRREDAEDVVQETFFKVSRNLNKIPLTGLGAWLRSINRRNAIDRLRVENSGSRRHRLKQQLEPDDVFTTGGFSQMELREALSAATETLPEKLREIVRLRYWEERSFKEIAERMNIPVGTVNWMLMDAFAALFTRLKDQVLPATSPPETEGNTQ